MTERTFAAWLRRQNAASGRKTARGRVDTGATRAQNKASCDTSNGKGCPKGNIQRTARPRPACRRVRALLRARRCDTRRDTMIKWNGSTISVCPVCGPAGCVDGPAHAVVLGPENNLEALDAFWSGSGRALGWFRRDPLAEATVRVADRGGGLCFSSTPLPLETLAARRVLDALAYDGDEDRSARGDAAAGAPAALRRALVGALRRRVDAVAGSGAGEPTRDNADAAPAAALLRALPGLARGARLRALDLSRIASPDAALAAAAPSLSSLTALDVSEGFGGGVGPDALRAALGKCARTLRVLGVAGCARIDAFGAVIPHLESLDARRCAALAPEAVARVLATSPRLATLLLADCGRVGDGAFSSGKAWPALRGVDVSRTRCSVDAVVALLRGGALDALWDAAR